jgi:iron complex outermembrane receptor protein
VDATGMNNFLPERGRQYEGGVKLALAQGRGEANLAAFQITKDNVLNALPGNFSEQIGQERSRGAEISVNQRVIDALQLIFGYAYTDSSVSKDIDPRRRGARALNAPRHSANLWARYDASAGALRGVGFGLGLVYKGDRAGSFPTTATATLPVLILPSYFRVDSGVYYTAKRFELTLAAVNLLDKLYYDSAQVATLQIRPGSPRGATFSLRFRL